MNTSCKDRHNASPQLQALHFHMNTSAYLSKRGSHPRHTLETNNNNLKQGMLLPSKTTEDSPNVVSLHFKPVKNLLSKFSCESRPCREAKHLQSSNLDKIRLSYGHLCALASYSTLGVLGLDGGASTREFGVMIVVVSCTLYII